MCCFFLSVCLLTHSEDLRTGMLANVTNHRLSDILLQHTCTHIYTRILFCRFTGKTKPLVRVMGSHAKAETQRRQLRGQVTLTQRDGQMDRGRERTEKEDDKRESGVGTH